MASILIIDDEAAIRSTLKEILEYENYKVDEAENGKEGLDKASEKRYDIIFCDIKMPGMDGIETLEKMQLKGIDSPVIMISGHGTVETAVEALKKGAYDFIEKPLDLNRILVTLRNATDTQALVQETKTLKRKIQKKLTVEIIGESAPILEIKSLIDTVAPTEARVLITGGNGSGKELVARQLHEKSERSSSPFIEVNCAAIPAELIESELFGHEKGAFTSAIKQRKGKFEQAHGGTLFLDEIGDMSLSAQAKVLRALQEHKITRVGGDKDIKVNVRIFAATNKDLRKEIEENNFREDLYHRLNVIPMHVPPLKERKEDIPLLADHFINQICGEYGTPNKEITSSAIKELQKGNWTGNIRELRNVIERLIILCPNKIDGADVKKYAQIA
ncbi:MAG: sigma-54 dependent transcriptional regulator [Flavobacteriales bacterium]|nr:sigma-54 dependent transcriptional regulator [Flavobacteriales bacterium]MDG1781550.1 sigma-54 dependent transcriptional regulator [Flavobacteriales bacterium]MDG2245331.1 sigma-54 dependent transcriptional regulator [Flavobacteriales bacterium]